MGDTRNKRKRLSKLAKRVLFKKVSERIKQRNSSGTGNVLNEEITASPEPYRESENVQENNKTFIELRPVLPDFFDLPVQDIVSDRMKTTVNELEPQLQREEDEEIADGMQTPVNELETVPQLPSEEDPEVADGTKTPVNELGTVPQLSNEEDEELVIEEENTDFTKNIRGRRLIDVKYFFEELQNIAAHNSLFQCNLSDMTLVSEKRIGLVSHFKFKCNLCGQFFKVTSDIPNTTEHVDVNTAACSAIIASGIGYSQFEEICSTMDVPVFTEKYFSKIQDQVFDEWEATAIEVMEAAAQREKDAAIAEGRLKDNIPVIDVYVDGAWSARSYGNNYRALSGVAAIVGRKFGEVLFIGVKNKYCLICARAEKKGETSKEHVCYKNYEGSSTGMEAAIICEGFKKSLEMYGLIYGNIIGDGDSSTYAKIVAANPYPNHTVSKIECRNHLLRNMCNKLRAMTKNTKYPLAHRKLITDQKILSMRKVITTSIKHNRQNRDESIKTIHDDVCQSIYHAFGDHRNCKSYYCTKQQTFENDVVPQIENSMLWFRIRVVINSVASKSRSLYENVDTNNVERFNGIIAKFVGGKRINFTQRRSYQARCSAAVVAFNTKKPIYTLHKRILGKSPTGNIKTLQQKRDKKRILSNIVERKKNRKRKLFTNQNDYGDSPAAPDMNEEEFKKAEKSFYERLKDLVKDRNRIEKKTVLQRDCSEWLELRKLILTASNFGNVIKRKKKHGNLVKQILYKKNISFVRSIAHGVENEHAALQQLAKQEKITINPCGLFIDKDNDFLGASPDGVVGNDTVVEVKCPVAAHKIGIKEAVMQNKIQILRFNKKNKTININKNSNWYFQAQGQLHITKRSRCIFGIWGGEDQKMEVLYINRDESFWKEKMEEKLISFYKKHMIPELVDSRNSRGIPIRD